MTTIQFMHKTKLETCTDRPVTGGRLPSEFTFGSEDAVLSDPRYSTFVHVSIARHKTAIVPVTKVHGYLIHCPTKCHWHYIADSLNEAAAAFKEHVLAVHRKELAS